MRPDQCRRLDSGKLRRSDVVRVVAGLHGRHLVVDQGLDHAPGLLAPDRIVGGGERGLELLFLLRRPPAGVVVVHHRDEDRIRHEAVVGEEQIPLLGLPALVDERRPIDHHHLDVDARVQELAGEHHGLIVVEGIVGRNQELDRRPVIPRLRGQRPRFLRVALAEQLRAGLRIPGVSLRQKRAVGAPQLLRADGDTQGVLFVERGLDGLAQLEVALQGSGLGVHEHEPEDRPAVQDHADRRILVHLVEQVARHALRVVVVARSEPVDARARIGNGNEAQAIEVRHPCACVPAGVTGGAGVAVEFHQLHVTVRPPLAEAVRAGADVVLDVDRRLAGRGRHCRRVDRRPAVDERHQVLPGAECALEDQLDAVVARRRDFGDVREEQLAAGAVFAPALQRSHDVGGGHGLAVMELHSLAKVDGDGRAVAADFFAGCEQRLRLVVCVERVQPLEDVVGDGGGEIGCHHMLVEAGRLAHGGIVQGASGKGGRRDGAAESQQGDAGDESRRCSRMLHDGYLPSLGGADPRRRIGRVIVKMIFIYCNSTPSIP